MQGVGKFTYTLHTPYLHHLYNFDMQQITKQSVGM